MKVAQVKHFRRGNLSLPEFIELINEELAKIKALHPIQWIFNLNDITGAVISVADSEEEEEGYEE